MQALALHTNLSWAKKQAAEKETPPRSCDVAQSQHPGAVSNRSSCLSEAGFSEPHVPLLFTQHVHCHSMLIMCTVHATPVREMQAMTDLTYRLC